MLIQNKIPILEYDTEPKAVIMPGVKGEPRLPERCAFLFLLDEVDAFASQHSCDIIGKFETITKTYAIYKTVYKDMELCFCQAPLGAPAAVEFLDYLIGCGVKKIIAAGCCGDLRGWEENIFLIPTHALRDEGTSYHYLPPARWVTLSERGIEAIEKVLKREDVPCRFCKTWTTDGFYRETPAMVHYRREEGCDAVEMECSAMAACAQFRGVQFAQLLFTADTLANTERHDERGWGKGAFPVALRLSLEALCEF